PSSAPSGAATSPGALSWSPPARRAATPTSSTSPPGASGPSPPPAAASSPTTAPSSPTPPPPRTPPRPGAGAGASTTSSPPPLWAPRRAAKGPGVIPLPINASPVAWVPGADGTANARLLLSGRRSRQDNTGLYLLDTRDQSLADLVRARRLIGALTSPDGA